MNKRSFAAAVALVNLVLTVPVLAGTTDVNGGKYSFTRQTVEHQGKSASSAEVYGSADRTLYQTGQVTETSFGSTVIDSANPSLVNKAIADYTLSGRNFIIAGRETYNANHGVDRLAGINIKGTSVTSASHSSRVSDGTSISLEDIKSENLIFVGDPDNLPSGYVAQGSWERRETIDEYYHYHTHTVYQVNTSGTVSPIVLDLDGDGKIQASNGRYLPHAGEFSKHAVMFDFYGNGFPVVCEWIGEQDGLLCRPNADGSVLGTNLFGTANGYNNGYEELASLDGNDDGVLEGAELEGLMVWVDSNANGIADKGELFTLDELGITAIGARHTNMVGTFVRHGQTYKSFDWWPSIVDCRKVGVASR